MYGSAVTKNVDMTNVIMFPIVKRDRKEVLDTCSVTELNSSLKRCEMITKLLTMDSLEMIGFISQMSKDERDSMRPVVRCELLKLRDRLGLISGGLDRLAQVMGVIDILSQV